MSEEPTLAEVSEEEILGRIFPHFRPTGAELLGPGDDAAVLAAASGSVVVTTDAMVRGRDWLDEWSTPEDVAAKSLTQNLADIAAMGAVPTAVVVALVADPATPVAWLERYAAELGSRCARLGVSVAGGDLSSAPAGTVMLSITALGDLAGREPLTRAGARVGDVLAVCGPLGRSGAGLALLSDGVVEADHPAAAAALAHHRRPDAPLAAGPQAVSAGAHALMDISDGLLRDAARIGRASGVAIDLDSGLLAEDIAALVPAVGTDRARECVLAGGEEHSLLAAYPSERGLPEGWRPVGAIVAGPAGQVAADGEATTPRGWDHFAG
ncbi:MAG: thiamine-phosphate kinase [Micrococcales bacterium]|nr:thiamine-phosphate kinase [Micrococcales bacterium]